MEKMIPYPPPPFPQRLKKQANDTRFSKFMTMLNQLTINVPLVEALEQMPGSEKGRPQCFHYSCTVGSMNFAKALYDLGASINLMPLSVYKKLGLGDPTPTNMRLIMADRSIKRPVGIVNDVLVKVSSFIFPADFVILDCEVDSEVSIILGRPFLATESVLIDIKANELLFRLNDEVVRFDICKAMKQPSDMNVFSIANGHHEDKKALSVEKQLTVEPLSAAPLNDEHEGDEDYEELIIEIESYYHTPKQPELDLKNQPSPTAKTSIKEPPMQKSKELPDYLRYVFFESGNILLISVADELSEQHVEALISALKRYKRAMGWTIDDIIGDPPGRRMSHLKEDCMPRSTMAPKARQCKDKATTSQKGKKRGRIEQAESSSLQIPRITLGIMWDTYEELLRMTTLMMIPIQGIEVIDDSRALRVLRMPAWIKDYEYIFRTDVPHGGPAFHAAGTGDGNRVMDYFTWFGCIELWKVDMVTEIWKVDMVIDIWKISNPKRREVHLGLVLKVDSQGHKPIMGRSQLICTGGSLMVTVQYSNDYKYDKNEVVIVLKENGWFEVESCLLVKCAGFLSLSCGGNTTYVDSSNITWTPDGAYISVGNMTTVDFLEDSSSSTLPVRFFPDSPIRNCYKIPLKNVSSLVLVRTQFVYKNYDGHNKPPAFSVSRGRAITPLSILLIPIHGLKSLLGSIGVNGK
ncbi:putative LRR receptor-like serine/threonine-protein kinase [Capsicum baccatum]|uniref:LRR receptor-like serine/threonine-protein kinase n=1 Tax=Capsicum baccatum TaxID=33114 RepID=A0A2G2VZC4_CAPBA|nr:putative LRR receptor-like serine/threonine-protein kinase [Capsicum baccatum]